MMLVLSLLVLALAAASPSDGQMKLQRGNCPESWFSFSGRCVKYFSSHVTWADAELHCVSQKANLVSIHSLEEHTFVNSLIKNFDPARRQTWIGLSDRHKEKRWMWSDGSAVNFVFWTAGEPNNLRNAEHCVHTSFKSEKKWNDCPCSGRYPFVCASHSKFFCGS
ncbi:lactose-binding lectin l-2-like [Nematolebias whitei]|uniref:lactose-binding lectin l-2-like n=1 Tax=Nematolebias whitei TaxID=451745 RepID=UPI00189B331F|nr:lactose-binding lectin l-2-like [Nematolebias whitei]